MTKPKPKPRRKPDENEAQSQRFMEEAERVVADGGLSPTEAADVFDKSLDSLLRSPRISE
jgi:hypothetical protein